MDRLVVEVVDSLMGSGKSTGIFRWMEEHSNERYIYVSPLLSEVDVGGRIHQEISSMTFECPQASSNSNKSDHLLELLRNGYNIACTHSLYLLMSPEHLEIIKQLGYIVILDEELEIINGLDLYSKEDLAWLIEHKHVSINEADGMVIWAENDNKVSNQHRYSQLKRLCDCEAVYAAKRDMTMMVTQLPLKLITNAKRVIILTYLFKNNILDCFLRLKGIRTTPFTEIKLNSPSKQTIRELITLVPYDSTLDRFSLSSSWYDRATKADIDSLSRLIANVARRYKARAKDVMWTSPKNKSFTSGQNRAVIRPNGYSIEIQKDGSKRSCWLSCSTRATNTYADKWCVIHLFDRYPLVSVDSYLSDYGSPIDRNVFALSELLQWAWRSRIRNNQPIVLCIGSRRMRSLFEEWLQKEG